jgi:IS4 transposase
LRGWKENGLLGVRGLKPSPFKVRKGSFFQENVLEEDMAPNSVLERFIKECPVPVMARLALQRAISAQWVDSVFEAHSERQYTRELLFSTTVSLMSQVALGFRPSLHAAATDSEDLPVSITSLYNKVNHSEPNVLKALIQGSAARLAPVVLPFKKSLAPFLPGYRTRILDGNCLATTDKRLKPLRGFRGTALPGFSLVVYDPDLELIVDLEPSLDAYAQERVVMNFLLERVQKGELWVADRHFSTRKIFFAITKALAAFIIREHGSNPNPTVRGKWKKLGRIETGMVFEQKVSIEDEEGRELLLRRVKVELDEPTEDGDWTIQILTNLPREISGKQVARLYRKRWGIEGMFQRLESVVKSEVRTLGNPKGALLAFGVSVLAYNVLSAIQRAVEKAHEEELAKEGYELSVYYVALDVKAYYEGMRVAVPEEEWERFEQMSPGQLSKVLLRVARQVIPKKLRNHPRSKPKIKTKKGSAPRGVANRHVSTARVLLAGKIE